MDCISTPLPYHLTGAFSKIVLDYIDGEKELKPFISYPSSLKGIQDAIASRSKFNYKRKTLVQELTRQYQDVSATGKVSANITSLLNENTFTITTAHQNNIFTGPLYFIYKILHAIKLAEQASLSFPAYKFIPVFYIGSEDADLAELNHIHLGGEKLEWETTQKGAVGRMKVDKNLLRLIDLIEGQVGVLPFGSEIISLLKQHYQEGRLLQDCTFSFVNELFGEYGLVVLLPDNPVLKSEMQKVFEDDLFQQGASVIVQQSADRLNKAGYKIQANPRQINLFYLFEDIRERIEMRSNPGGDTWHVLNTDIKFTKEELQKELKNFPERFSPNVILRGLYQETILPNVAFIGGGGETAYWLQLKDLFKHYDIPFPVLILRNSFLVIENKWKKRINSLAISNNELFLPADELFNQIVLKETTQETSFNGSLTALEELYEDFRRQAVSIDATLEKHVEALKKKTIFRLHELEKKMLRAEKKKYSDKLRQVNTLKSQLFPEGDLQERYDNLSYYYAKYGESFIRTLYENSLTTQHEFVVLTET